MTSNDEVDSSHSHPLFGSKSAHSHLLEREHAKPKASKVYDSLSNITELSLRSGLEKQARPPDSLRARLFRRLRIENSALKEIGQPERDVNLLGTKIWNTLKSQAHEFDDCTIQWCDQYCTLPCRDKSSK